MNKEKKHMHNRKKYNYYGDKKKTRIFRDYYITRERAKLVPNEDCEAQKAVQESQPPESSPLLSIDTTQKPSSNESVLPIEPSNLKSINNAKNDLPIVQEYQSVTRRPPRSYYEVDPELDIIKFDRVLVFTPEDVEQSELSAYTITDIESDKVTSEFDDFEYKEVRKYPTFNRKNIIRRDAWLNIETLENYLETYWKKLIELNDKRNVMVYALNKQLKKSKCFSNSDIRHFNACIITIESNLNILAPSLSILQTKFIKDTNHKQVMFQGYKYSRIGSSLKSYSCTYDQNTDALMFGPVRGCRACLNIDEKGFLQPGTFIVHYHNPIEKSPKDPEPLKQERISLQKLTAEGAESGKRYKMNKFLEEKLQEALKFSIDIQKTQLYANNINNCLSKLNSINEDELEEADKNYLRSSKEWADFFMLHIKITNLL